jgi:hypothetical protein
VSLLARKCDMTKFRRPAPTQHVPATPEQLFNQLPRGAGPATLWSHQADVLRSYDRDFQNKPDVAIELPTGTGKTLPGLLLADWNRRFRGARVVFACPTVQLVKQVMRAALRQGIPVVDLSGSWRDWDGSDKMRFEQAQAVAVVSYSTIFNSKPHLHKVDTLVFDDAHAGEQYVAGAYSVEVDRLEAPALYEALRSSLARALPSGVAARLAESDSEAAGRATINLVLPGLEDGLGDRLDAAISANTTKFKGVFWEHQTIKGHLDACMVYMSWHEVLIRPFIPPTFENELFYGARQRIYLSATLGDAGELERAFGRQSIQRLPLPASAGVPRSGRRFIIFPTLTKGTDPLALARSLEECSERAIVLTPSNFGLKKANDQLVPLGWKKFAREDVENGFDEFAATPQAICVLANRYDGIDLPHDACRVVTLLGHPRSTHMQEDFLASRAKATAAIAERVRSRVVQGTGRCTRNPEDFALVIIADADTANFLGRPDVRKTLDPALQAEIEFGIENSMGSRADVIEYVKSFIAQDTDWQEGAEPEIARLQSSVTRAAAPGSDSLKSSVTDEVRASELAWQGVWEEASVDASSAAHKLTGDNDVRTYRAFWLLLAGYYANVAVRGGRGSSVQLSERLVKQALQAAQPQTWVRELTPFPGLPEEPLLAHDVSAVNALSAELKRGGFNDAKNIAKLEAMAKGLRETGAKDYEPALTVLGRMLGADAFKPDTHANCDSAWCWDNYMWVTIEAKSGESAGDALSVDTVREANGHLALLAADRGNVGIPTPHSASVIASPRTSIDPQAMTIARRALHLVSLDDMMDLGDEVQKLWNQLRPLRFLDGNELAENVTEVLRRTSLLPSAVFERLTRMPVVAD